VCGGDTSLSHSDTDPVTIRRSQIIGDREIDRYRQTDRLTQVVIVIVMSLSLCVDQSTHTDYIYENMNQSNRKGAAVH
jgi:hypothetical protein